MDSISDDEHDTPTPTGRLNPQASLKPSTLVDDENSRSDIESADPRRAKKRKRNY